MNDLNKQLSFKPVVLYYKNVLAKTAAKEINHISLLFQSLIIQCFLHPNKRTFVFDEYNVENFSYFFCISLFYHFYYNNYNNCYYYILNKSETLYQSNKLTTDIGLLLFYNKHPLFFLQIRQAGCITSFKISTKKMSRSSRISDI